MSIVVWFILSYGLMNIMVYGSIFQGLRNFFRNWGENKYMPFNSLGEFISTWGGFVLSLLIYSPTNAMFSTPLWCSWFFDGILSSGAVWAINAIVEWFEQNRPSNQ